MYIEPEARYEKQLEYTGPSFVYIEHYSVKMSYNTTVVMIDALVPNLNKTLGHHASGSGAGARDIGGRRGA